MYVYQVANADKEIPNASGRYVAGIPIGVILFGVAGYTLPPGTVENATTYKYPVHFMGIPAAITENVVNPEPHPEVLKQLVNAGKFMQSQGVRAIVGACGYFGNYLPAVKKQLDVPCFFSSLMQLPVILNSISENKKVGVICANSEILPKSNVLKNCGITKENLSRLVIRGGGGEEIPEMTNKILKNTGSYNPKQLEREVVDVAVDMVKKDPDISALMLECTLYPAISYAVQEALHMPVCDFMTMIDWVHSAVVQKPYYGYI